MATSELENNGQNQALLSEDCSILKQVLRRYGGVVHTLAMHLTNDDDAAEQVTIEVFTRLSQERHLHVGEPLDKMIHRFTYDAALPLLVEKITKHTEEVDAFGYRVAGPGNTLVC